MIVNTECYICHYLCCISVECGPKNPDVNNFTQDQGYSILDSLGLRIE